MTVHPLRWALALACAAAAVWAPAAAAAEGDPPQPLAPAAGAQLRIGAPIVFRIRTFPGDGFLWLHVSTSPQPAQACGVIGSETEIEPFAPSAADPSVYEARPTYYDYAGFWMNTPGTYYWQAYRISYANGADGCIETPVQTLVLTRPTFPLADALLTGSWDVKARVTSAAGFGGIRRGTTLDATWRFTPACKGRRCAVRLTGYSRGRSWSMRLARKGAEYRGTAKVRLSRCFSWPVVDTLTVRLRVTSGAWTESAWRAAAARGTLKDTAPAFRSGRYHCPAARFAAALTAAPG